MRKFRRTFCGHVRRLYTTRILTTVPILATTNPSRLLDPKLLLPQASSVAAFLPKSRQGAITGVVSKGVNMERCIFCALLCLLTSNSCLADTLRVDHATTSPGNDVTIVLRLTTDEAISGYQTVIVVDPSTLTFIEATTSGLDIERLLVPYSLEFFVTVEDAVPDGHMIAQAAIFDFSPPLDQQSLPPGSDRSVVEVTFSTSNATPVGTQTEVLLLNNQGRTNLSNIVVVNGTSQRPELQHGSVWFLPNFIRGDVDQNGILEPLADAVFLLRFGFITGSHQPNCLNAADVDDNGQVSPLVDTLYLLAFSFQQGRPVPAPVTCGLDPTFDVSDCSTSSCP